jgi:alkanesulfonate monooxygenase SsuD/methylene tetrahydromethanopterin reductase-like flavin-dependent oxidoreductase (luciferase family)
MKFGLSGCGGGLESPSTARLVELAQFAEDVGFQALWINEEHFQAPSHGHGRLCLSPLILAAFLAAQTRRIRLGFSVLLLSLHQPLRLAEEIASLDVLSGGRVDFGISRSGNQQYATAFRFDSKENSIRFQEDLAIILRAWSDDTLTIGEGAYSVQPKPVQRPHPPIYIGGYTEESVRWAGAAGHHLIQHGIQSLTTIRANLQRFADTGGLVAEVPVGRFVYIAESDAQARAELWPVIEELTARLRRIGIGRRGPIISEDELEPERFYHEVAIVGSPTTCAQRIAGLREELGVDYLNCLAAFFGYLPEDLLRRSLKLFADQVMPHFAPKREEAR